MTELLLLTATEIEFALLKRRPACKTGRTLSDDGPSSSIDAIFAAALGF
jgi:hypothetical protein